MQNLLKKGLIFAILGFAYCDDVGDDLNKKVSLLSEKVISLSNEVVNLKDRVANLEVTNSELKSIIANDNIKSSMDSEVRTAVDDMVQNKTLEERVSHLEDLAMIKSLRSCHEYSRYGITNSGLFTIDPDGDLVGLEPIEVYCNFQEQTTQVMHDHEFVVDIPHCEDDYCYRLNISYSAPIEQITTLIELSETCDQEIKFSCFLSALYDTDTPIGAWINRNGDPEIYFDGANHGTHMCQCSLDDSCSDSSHGAVCNCDANFIPEMQADEGRITDVAALPITGFVYGDLVYESQIAQIEIGRLKCRGQKQMEPKEITENCSNLKRGGVDQSGNYVMSDGNVAFCDMSKSMNDEKIQSTIGEIHYKDVMFIAKIEYPTTSGYISTGTLTFDTLEYDYAGNFDKTTGVFTASNDGYYLFTFYGYEYPTSNSYLTLCVNGVDNQSVVGMQESSGGVSHMWSLKLEQGDEVTLKNINTDRLYISSSYGNIIFTGRLVI